MVFRNLAKIDEDCMSSKMPNMFQLGREKSYFVRDSGTFELQCSGLPIDPDNS